MAKATKKTQTSKARKLTAKQTELYNWMRSRVAYTALASVVKAEFNIRTINSLHNAGVLEFDGNAYTLASEYWWIAVQNVRLGGANVSQLDNNGDRELGTPEAELVEQMELDPNHDAELATTLEKQLKLMHIDAECRYAHPCVRMVFRADAANTDRLLSLYNSGAWTSQVEDGLVVVTAVGDSEEDDEVETPDRSYYPGEEEDAYMSNRADLYVEEQMADEPEAPSMGHDGLYVDPRQSHEDEVEPDTSWYRDYRIAVMEQPVVTKFDNMHEAKSFARRMRKNYGYKNVERKAGSLVVSVVVPEEMVA